MKALFNCLAILVAAPGLIHAAWVSPAIAEDLPIPICARPAVLVQVTEALQRAGRTFTIETASVGQVPTVQPGVVRCAVRVHTTVFDTNQMGGTPLDRVTVFDYALQSRENGIFIRPLGERPL